MPDCWSGTGTSALGPSGGTSRAVGTVAGWLGLALLLGLLREPKSVGVRILVNLGADPSRVRQQVVQMVPGRHSQQPGPAVGPRQLRARFGSRESAVSQDRIVGALTAIGDRLTAIERRLGISRQSPPGPFDEQIAELRRAKEAAIDSRDFEQAAALRDQEKRLIAQQEAGVRGQEPSGPGGSARQGWVCRAHSLTGCRVAFHRPGTALELSFTRRAAGAAARRR